MVINQQRLRLSDVSMGDAGDLLTIQRLTMFNFSVPVGNAVVINGSGVNFTTLGQEISVTLTAPLTSLAISLTDSPRLYYLKLNGSLVVDHNNIGVDDNTVTTMTSLTVTSLLVTPVKFGFWRK